MNRYRFLVWMVPVLLMISCGGNASATVVPAPPTETEINIPTVESEIMATPTPIPTPFPQEVEDFEANADVVHVRAVMSSNETWTFHVTVAHPDTGWDDYADGWDVVTPDGSVLKRNADDPFTRLLTHPHETEQPFTRSQSGIEIPAGILQVTVRAHDLVDGFGGAEVVVDLGEESGPGYEVER